MWLPYREAKIVAEAVVETWITWFWCPVNLTQLQSRPSVRHFRDRTKTPTHCMYEKRHTESYLTPGGSIFKTRREFYRAHHWIRIQMEVEQSRQTTYYDYCAYGPTHWEGRKFLSFAKQLKRSNRKSASIYEESYKLFNFAGLSWWQKTMKAPYKRLKQYKWERNFYQKYRNKKIMKLAENCFFKEVDDGFIVLGVRETTEPESNKQNGNIGIKLRVNWSTKRCQNCWRKTQSETM